MGWGGGGKANGWEKSGRVSCIGALGKVPSVPKEAQISHSFACPFLDHRSMLICRILRVGTEPTRKKSNGAFCIRLLLEPQGHTCIDSPIPKWTLSVTQVWALLPHRGRYRPPSSIFSVHCCLFYDYLVSLHTLTDFFNQYYLLRKNYWVASMMMITIIITCLSKAPSEVKKLGSSFLKLHQSLFVAQPRLLMYDQPKPF